MISPPLLEREIIRRGGLHEFVRRAWPLLESAQFQDNWHIGIICEVLEAVSAGEIKRLVVNQPPGTMKSRLIAAFWPAWEWTLRPETRWIYATYEASLAHRDAKAHREMVADPWYQAIWPEVRIPTKASKKVTLFENNHKGWRFSTSPNGGGTGRHCHHQVVDDPIKPKDTQGSSDTTRKVIDKCTAWWDGTMSSRQADPAKGMSRTIVMQRLHDADLAGVVLEREHSVEPYVHLMLPMRYEPKRKFSISTPSGKSWTDPRETDGELLWPERFPEKAVAALEEDLGPFASAQLQQDPVPSAGGIFKIEWLDKFWTPSKPNGEPTIPGTIPLPKLSLMQILQSWDMSFKKTDASDFVGGGVWAKYLALFFLLERFNKRCSFTDSLDEIRIMTGKHPYAFSKLVEDKANGAAVIDTLKREIPGIEAVEPEGGKESRAYAVSNLFKAGNVVLPHKSIDYNIGAYIQQMIRFPKAPHDDEVDQTTQALHRLHIRGSRLAEAMRIIAAERKAKAA